MRDRMGAVVLALSSVFLGLGATVSAVAADAPTGPALVATQTDYKIHAGDSLLVGVYDEPLGSAIVVRSSIPRRTTVSRQ